MYFNGAQPCDKEENCIVDTEHEVWWELECRNGTCVLKTNLGEYLPESTLETISTETLGEAFEPEQKFENPDGTPIVFNKDYYGRHRAVKPACGPFEKMTGEMRI